MKDLNMTGIHFNPWQNSTCISPNNTYAGLPDDMLAFPNFSNSINCLT